MMSYWVLFIGIAVVSFGKQFVYRYRVIIKTKSI